MPTHRDLLHCDSTSTCCVHKDLVVDVEHTFLDFVTLVVVHASVIYQRNKKENINSNATQHQQRVDFVFWEGKGMECNDAFKAAL